MYNKESLTVLGTTILKVKNPKNGRKRFVIVKDGTIPLLGSRTAQHMELIKVQYRNIQEAHAVTSTQQTECGQDKVTTNS